MKRVSFERRLWLYKHALKAFRKRQRRKNPNLTLDKAIDWGMVSCPVNLTPERILIINPPAIFSFSANYDAVCLFFETLRRESLKTNEELKREGIRGIRVDFTKIQELAPAAGLVLAAELDRWRRVKGFRFGLVDQDKWNLGVKRTLMQLGFFDLLDMEDVSADFFNGVKSEADDGIRMLQYRSGKKSSAETTLELSGELEKLSGPIFAKNHLYDGIMEAMLNVSYHAYPKYHRYRHRPDYDRWWMTASFDSLSLQTKVIFFDQGVGIPATLPKSSKMEKARELLARWGVSLKNDSAMIAAAVETTRTAIGTGGHGHGLEDIKRFVESSEIGTLRILSRRGEYLYSRGNEPRRIEHPISVGGTLIEWEVRRVS